MYGTLSDDFDDFPVINTCTGLVDMIRNTISTGVLYGVDEFGSIGLCERHDFISEFGYFIPTQEFIDAVKKLDQKWLSIGCGRGYIEKILNDNGIDVVATDMYSVANNPYFKHSENTHPYTDIEVIDAVCATKKYSDRSILMSWVPKGALWPIDVVSLLGNNLLLSIGEKYGGCTGHDNFHKYVDTNFERIVSIPHVRFVGITDSIDLYKPNA